MKIEITAKDSAPRKIKNKIKEHGSIWIIEKDDEFELEPAILARAFESHYQRWFLKSQIEYKELK